ncbi:uncharacterized protein [Penaeus vannamei]|uniref:uncharacterized protein n=1 Tax=Penaeus vannamei TaxID=6689 RepID=UPI000F68C61F|nr:uncharacterized protein LOC113819628 [Penaeus vannamei]XP_027227639.1 uncharacterized protein LOC113819631 [Penaeus vannamei]
MYLRILLACATCACAVSAQRYEALGVLQPARPTGLGDHEKMVTATIEILPDVAKTLRELAMRMARSQDDPFDSQNMFEILMAFMPVTRRIMFSVAKAEGRTVSEEELQRLDQAERMFPSAFKFLVKMHGGDLFGFEDPDAEKAPTEDAAALAEAKVSGSFVQMPHGRGMVIHHG